MSSYSSLILLISLLSFFLIKLIFFYFSFKGICRSTFPTFCSWRVQNALSNISKAVLEPRPFHELHQSFPLLASLSKRHSVQTKLTVSQALYFEDNAPVKLLRFEGLRV